jgi:phosphoribosylformylglycinamidine synthase
LETAPPPVKMPRAVVTCAPGRERAIRDAAAEAGIRSKVVGKVGGERLKVTLDGGPCVDLAVAEIRDAWENGLGTVVGWPMKLRVGE